MSEIGSGGRGDLVPVHGGLAEPVDCVVPLKERNAFLAEAATLPAVRANRADLSTVHRLADGVLSPLDGPMDEESWHRALDEKIVLSLGNRYAWTIPLSLPVSDSEARSLSRGCSAAVQDENGNVVAIIDGVECFEWDKVKYVKGVYGTDRFDHPGGHAVKEDTRSKLIGGRIRALPQTLHPEYGEYMLSPHMTRALIRDRKWERALAFQTRNPLHRAHEYALVASGRRHSAPRPPSAPWPAP